MYNYEVTFSHSLKIYFKNYFIYNNFVEIYHVIQLFKACSFVGFSTFTELRGDYHNS